MNRSEFEAAEEASQVDQNAEGKGESAAKVEIQKDKHLEVFHKQYYVVDNLEEVAKLRNKMTGKLAEFYADVMKCIDHTFSLPEDHRRPAQERLNEGFMHLEKGILKLPIITKEQEQEIDKQLKNSVPPQSINPSNNPADSMQTKL